LRKHSQAAFSERAFSFEEIMLLFRIRGGL